MSDTPDLSPMPQRIHINVAQVHRLIAEQFPQWAHLPNKPVANGGWDKWTYHLGTEMLIRLPSAAQ